MVDLNAEFDNVIANFLPTKVDSYSHTVTEMRIQTSPGGVGTESQATSLAGELERLRFMIAAITGQTYWYQLPSKSLAAGSANIAWYLAFDGGTALEAWRDSIARGAIINAASRISEDFVPGDLDSTNKKFGNFSWDLGTGNFLGAWNNNQKADQGTLSAHFYNIGVQDYIAYNPLLGIELMTNASGHLVAKVTKSATASETDKSTASVTGTNVVTGNAVWANVIMKWATNGAMGSGSDALGLKLSGTDEGTQVTSSTISTQSSPNAPWFLGVKRNDPTWSHYSAMQVVPSAEAVSAWSTTGTGSAAVSGGVLTITTDASHLKRFFSRTDNVTLTGMTVEFKMKINSYQLGAAGETPNQFDSPVAVQIRKDSANLSLYLAFSPNGISLVDGDIGAANIYKNIQLNCKDWHVYRLVFTSALSVDLYIDGAKVYTFSLQTADATAGDIIAFGDITDTVTGFAVSQWEYFAYSNASATAPLAAGSQGSLDDVVLLTDYVNDTSLEGSFSTTQASVVVGKDVPLASKYVPVKRQISLIDGSGSNSITGTTLTSLQGLLLAAIGLDDSVYVASDGVRPTRVIISVPVSHNATGEGGYSVMNIDNEVKALSGDFDLTYPIVNLLKLQVDKRVYIVLSLCQILKPGLRQLTYWSASNSANTYTTDIGNMTYDVIPD
jgi:hypothetical protein